MINAPWPETSHLLFAGVVPGEHAGRKRRDDLPEPAQDFLHGIRVDRDVAFGVDELRPLRGEHGADPVDRVAPRAERHAKRVARFGAFFSR